MKQIESDVDSKASEDLKVGQLYEWNGHELVPVQKSEQVKVPVTMEAMDAVRKTRAKATGDDFRPCLMVTASQMLLAASAQIDDLPDQVVDYGIKVYSELARKKRRS